MKQLICLLILLLAVGVARPLHATDAVVGIGTAESCTETAFDNALEFVQDTGGGAITFDCGGAITIPFSSEKLVDTDGVTLEGAGLITLSGSGSTRLFLVDTDGRLTIQEMILTDGYSGSSYGGAVYVENNGTFIAENSTIKDSATDDWAGGAIIDFGGTVTLIDSIVANNQSNYGAINSIGTLEIVGSTIMSNTATIAGGALSVGGEVIIQNSHIHHNSAPNGGALLIGSSADVDIVASTFNDNIANGTIIDETGGGAILSDGFLSIERSTFEDNVSEGSGGAIQTGYQTAAAETYILQTAVISNQAALHGGGISNAGGTLQLINSTVSHNLSQGSGGGVSSFLGPTTLLYVTAAHNQGGNLNQITAAGNQDDRQRINLSKTAVVGGEPNCQVTGNPTPDPLPYFNTQDHNLSDDASCDAYLTGDGDHNNTNAQLGPLAPNGGPTQTHMPLGGSSLLDAATCSPDFLTDQRGFSRPEFDSCDIGAIESAGVPLTQILPRYYRLAFDHLESVRGGPMTPNWAEARLSLRTTPLYRPDLPQPAYYEFQVDVPSVHGYEPAGFIMVSTDVHDFPIPHWSNEAEAPTQMLLRKAGEQGSLLPFKYFRLDALAYASEDDQGGLASMSDSTFNKIIRPPGPLPNVELSRRAWEPETAPPADDVPANITYNLVSEGPMTSTIELSGWASWDEIKSEYADTYEPYLDHLEDEANEAWEAVTGPIGLFPGDSYVLPLIEAGANVQLSGEGVTFVTVQDTILPGDRHGVTIQIADVPQENSLPFQVSISTPAEQVDFMIWPSLNEVYLPVMMGGSASTDQATLQTNGPTAVTGWGDWRHYRAGFGTTQRYYRQIQPLEAPNFTPCPSGCGATAWAMLFGWADHQAWLNNPRWAHRWGIYRVNGGYGANADAPGYMGPNQGYYHGIYNMTWEIKGYLDTLCIFGAGPTWPGWMADAQDYLYGRSYAHVDTRYNILGWSENRLMNDAANSIIFNKTPAIIGTGWLNHYPLAWGYSSRTYYYGWGFTRTTRYFYVNQGWATTNEWVSASTWFSGELLP